MKFQRGDISDRANNADDPVLEPLEVRLLLAASVRRGVLTIPGTSGDDDVSVFFSRGKITVFLDRSGQVFNATGVHYIRFNGGAGDDWFGSTGKFPVLLVGGAGDDSLFGGGSADFLDGGDGADLLDSGAGGGS